MRFSDVEEQACRPLGGPSFPIARHVGVSYTGSDGFDPVLSDFGILGYPPTEYQIFQNGPTTQPRLTWTVPDVNHGYNWVNTGSDTPSWIWYSDSSVVGTAIGPVRVLKEHSLTGQFSFIPRCNYVWITPSDSTPPSALDPGGQIPKTVPGGHAFIGSMPVSGTNSVTDQSLNFGVFAAFDASNVITGFNLYRKTSAFNGTNHFDVTGATLIAGTSVLSHTATSSGFTVPASGSNVVVPVSSAAWITANAAVLKDLIIAGAGLFEIVSVSGNNLTLKYLVTVPGTATRYNTHSGLVINSGANVMPGSYSDTLAPSPELFYRMIGVTATFSYPNNDVTVGVQAPFQDFGIDWVGTGLPEGLGLTALNGLPGVANITIRDTTNPEGFDWENAAQLVTASFPNLTSCANQFIINGAPLFTTLSIPVFVPFNGQTMDFSSCALNATSVNGVLARAVANAGYVSGSINLSGGTNAAPTGQGVTNKSTLQGRGVTVTTN